MTEMQIFEFMGTNRGIFASYLQSGILLSLVVVVVAYLFRNLPSAVRAGAMVSSLIAVIMMAFYTTAAQNVFFGQLSSLSMAAADGSEIARNFLVGFDMPIGQEITPPMWQVALQFVQLIVNLILTVYVFMMAKWND